MMRERPLWLILCVSALFALAAAAAQHSTSYDLVILDCRVMDPETGLDAVRNVGVRYGRIETITTETLQGRNKIDARGLVVAPGFIDFHQLGQNDENYRYKVADGVTSALNLEDGTANVDDWYAEREGKALINHGVSVSHMMVRMRVLNDPGTTAPLGDAGKRLASESEIAAMKEQIGYGLARGALGTGFIFELTQAASSWEILEMFRATAGSGAPAVVHVRYGEITEPRTAITAIEEVLAASALTGVPVHWSISTAMPSGSLQGHSR